MNYAFIDSQNLNMATQNLGWNLDWSKFRSYLKADFTVETAYLFIGYMPEHQEIYSAMQKAGYIVIFKPVTVNREGDVKGNIDAELVLQAMIDIERYDKAVIVTGDGDFASLISHLTNKNKLESVIIPNQRQYSALLKQAAKDRVTFLNNMRRDLEYRRFNSHKPQQPAPAAPEPTTTTEPVATPSPQAPAQPQQPAAPQPQPTAPRTQSRPRGRSSATSQLEDSIIKATSAPAQPARQPRPQRPRPASDKPKESTS